MKIKKRKSSAIKFKIMEKSSQTDLEYFSELLKEYKETHKFSKDHNMFSKKSDPWNDSFMTST